jgi:hypothetical protein
MVSISQTYYGPNDLRRTYCIIKHRAHIIRVKVDLAGHAVEMSFRTPRMNVVNAAHNNGCNNQRKKMKNHKIVKLMQWNLLCFINAVIFNVLHIMFRDYASVNLTSH